jgi:hypothetical protein
MLLKSAQPLVSSTLVFRGEEHNPLLAPRGVCLSAGKLIVSDTGQNRVFIWNELPRTEFQTPDVVLGQLASADTGRNAGGAGSSASTLQYPSGVWSDGTRLVVADAWNHRVLIWLTFPTTSGQAADVVIGQPDFTSNEPNIVGLSQPPTSQSLYWCYGVHSDGERLWIADTGNRRVLVFNQFPTQSYLSADEVIGQISFSERDYDTANAVWPYSVKVSPDGRTMAIADTQSYRVLLWNDWKDGAAPIRKQADVVLGQPDFAANGQNQYSFFPNARTLSWCYDTLFMPHGHGLMVADAGNSRVLLWKNVPSQHNASADNVVGQEHFAVSSENKDSVASTENSLYWPFSLAFENDMLAIADTGNHRIMLCRI